MELAEARRAPMAQAVGVLFVYRFLSKKDKKVSTEGVYSFGAFVMEKIFQTIFKKVLTNKPTCDIIISETLFCVKYPNYFHIISIHQSFGYVNTLF